MAALSSEVLSFLTQGGSNPTFTANLGFFSMKRWVEIQNGVGMADDSPALSPYLNFRASPDAIHRHSKVYGTSNSFVESI